MGLQRRDAVRHRVALDDSDTSALVRRQSELLGGRDVVGRTLEHVVGGDGRGRPAGLGDRRRGLRRGRARADRVRGEPVRFDPVSEGAFRSDIWMTLRGRNRREPGPDNRASEDEDDQHEDDEATTAYP
ncbi:hypothetical protein BRD06_09220 [Halobacteriales archaeon QS_9_67_15]|nr:MAG: hypothetical protein BRD06_09220 [Halobacteriales archaeon QS_9_67_15]